MEFSSVGETSTKLRKTKQPFVERSPVHRARSLEEFFPKVETQYFRANAASRKFAEQGYNIAVRRNLHE